jgi:hypothetical protein
MTGRVIEFIGKFGSGMNGRGMKSNLGEGRVRGFTWEYDGFQEHLLTPALSSIPWRKRESCCNFKKSVEMRFRGREIENQVINRSLRSADRLVQRIVPTSRERASANPPASAAPPARKNRRQCQSLWSGRHPDRVSRKLQ